MLRITIITLVSLIIGCSSKPTELTHPKFNQFKLLDFKAIVGAPSDHWIFLYHINSENTDTLKMFCLQQKNQLSTKEGVNYYHLIFFDDSLLADFPISGIFYIREKQL